MSLLSIVLVALAALSVLLAVMFLLRGLGTRQQASKELYAVGRQAQRRTMQVNMVRSAAFLIVGLISLGVFGLSQRPVSEPEPTPTATTAATQTPQATTTRPATDVPAPVSSSTPAATPTTPQDIPTLTPTATSTATATPNPPTAIVASPNGLYLREAPGGSQELELIPDGAELLLLDGSETFDELVWQRVRTPTGNEGWVAVDFIIIQEDE